MFWNHIYISLSSFIGQKNHSYFDCSFVEIEQCAVRLRTLSTGFPLSFFSSDSRSRFLNRLSSGPTRYLHCLKTGFGRTLKDLRTWSRFLRRFRSDLKGLKNRPLLQGCEDKAQSWIEFQLQNGAKIGTSSGGGGRGGRYMLNSPSRQVPPTMGAVTAWCTIMLSGCIYVHSTTHSVYTGLRTYCTQPIITFINFQ